MSDEEVIIRQSKYKLMFYAFCFGLIIIVGTCQFIFSDSQVGKKAIAGILIFIFLFLLFLHFVVGLVKQTPEIILTKAGIEMNSIGFFPWEMLSSFSILRYVENGEEDLVLQFHDNLMDVKFPIHILEYDNEELKNLIIKVSGKSSGFFAGYATKR